MASVIARLTPLLLFFGLLGWALLPMELPMETVDWATLRSRCCILPISHSGLHDMLMGLDLSTIKRAFP